MEVLPTEILMTVVTAVIGGVAWLVKRYFNKKDEQQKRIFDERDKDKQEIKENIKNLQSDVKTMKRHLTVVSAMVLKCDNPDCPTKKELAAYLEKEDI